MGIKKYNPYTPSRRQMTGLDVAEITKTEPETVSYTHLSDPCKRLCTRTEEVSRYSERDR